MKHIHITLKDNSTTNIKKVTSIDLLKEKGYNIQ